jgi:fructosamine-3-kinase
MHKIRGAAGAELARGAGRAGGIEADGNHVVKAQAGFLGGEFKAIGDLLQANARALFGERRVFAQTLDQKRFITVEQCVVDRGSTQIDSRYSWHSSVPSLLNGDHWLG